MKKLSLLIMCLILSACNSINTGLTKKPYDFENITVKDHVSNCNTRNLNLEHLDLETKINLKEVAAQNAIYAMLSTNVYGNKENTFILPKYWQENESKRYSDRQTGLDYHIYEKIVDGKIVEAVIAFRGTAGVKDWIYGNLSNKQYETAKGHIQSFINDYKGTSLKATGHSLGGGLAIYASYQFEEKIKAIAFNTSPRYHSKSDKKENERILIYEKGEPNRLAGRILFPWRWDIFNVNMKTNEPIRYNFLTGGFGLRNIIRNHRSSDLAKGLLLSANLNDVERINNIDLFKTLKENCDPEKNLI